MIVNFVEQSRTYSGNVAVLVKSGKGLLATAQALDRASRGTIARALKAASRFDGKKHETLALLARGFELGEYLRLGSGELKSGGFRRESILADALEALIGAIYLDSGMESARERVLAWLANELEGLTLVDTNKDPKTRLQEFLQSRACELPRYEVVDIQGEPHCRTFFVECQVNLLNDKTQGQGASRRIAEQVAAAAALVALGVENGND